MSLAQLITSNTGQPLADQQATAMLIWDRRSPIPGGCLLRTTRSDFLRRASSLAYTAQPIGRLLMLTMWACCDGFDGMAIDLRAAPAHIKLRGFKMVE